jgi:nucleoside-diphosphate-sugar epimerase
MRCLVTGSAGFIGAHLAHRLVGAGHDVVGVDCLRPNYDVAEKKANLAWVAGAGALDQRDVDLSADDLVGVLDGVEVVFHLAGQPGVRDSWGDGLAAYTRDNVLATERLLVAAHGAGVRRFVLASSSSVYGEAARFPCREDDLPRPHSPYGVTKLAAEHLGLAHAHNDGLPVTALRYFSVYGPRQRPDMGLRRLFDAAATGSPFPRYGDGSQVRDLTYVGDVVDATVLAAERDLEPGGVLNVAGGSAVTLAELIERVEVVTGRAIEVDQQAAQAGDVARTGGDTTRIGEALGWTPATSLDDGLAAMADWACGSS